MPSITIVNGWHVLDLSADILPLDINRKGFTQFRLRFDGSNNDSIADVMSFYSGNASTAAYRPQLFLKYYVP